VTQNPAARMFESAKFIQWMGVELLNLADGICEAKLIVRDEFLQQDGFVHAGILTTLADHCAGGAVGSLLRPHQRVLSIEFKTGFLRPAKSRELYCRSISLKTGKSIGFAESVIYSSLKEMQSGATEGLIAKSSVTLAVLNSA